MEHNFWLLITSEAVVSRLWFSLWLSSGVMLGSLVLGGGLAVWERWRRVSVPRWFLALCAAVLFLPPAIVGTGFIQLLGRVGDVNTVLAIFGVQPLLFLYMPAAVILAHLYYNIPLAYLSIKTALDQISRHTEETAQLMGASRWAIWRDVWWPHMKHAVVGVAAIIFLYNLTSFVLPLLLGGIHAQTLEVWLYQQIYVYHNYNNAYVIAGLQTLLLTVPIIVLLRRRVVPMQQFVPSHTLKPAALVLHCARMMLVLLLLAPLLSLIIHTFQEITWSNMIQLGQSNLFPSLGRSVLLALGIVAAAMTLTLMVRGGFSWLMVLLTLSPVTVGFVWLMTFGKGYVSFSLALLCSVLPVVSYFIDYALKQRPRYFTETAQWLGASVWQQRWLELGYIQPVLKRTAAVGITLVLSDVALANLLAPYHSPTGMQVALNFVSNYRFALGSLAMVIMLFFISGVQLLLYARR